MNEPEDDVGQPDAQADELARDVHVGAILFHPNLPAGDPQVQDDSLDPPLAGPPGPDDEVLIALLVERTIGPDPVRRGALGVQVDVPGEDLADGGPAAVQVIHRLTSSRTRSTTSSGTGCL